MQTQAQKDAIAKKLQKKLGRPPTTEKEKRVRAAVVDNLAGDKKAQVMRRYGVAIEDLNRLMKQAFPLDADRFEFMEDCMLANSMLAMGVFQEKYTELGALDAAKAAVMFAGKGLEIKKAREAGYKEQPINVLTLIKLENTLNAAITKQAAA